MKIHAVERGLFVSWGGYTRDVQRAAKRSFPDIRLWGAGDLVQAIQSVYHDLPSEVQGKIPMKQIWVLREDE